MPLQQKTNENHVWPTEKTGQQLTVISISSDKPKRRMINNNQWFKLRQRPVNNVTTVHKREENSFWEASWCWCGRFCIDAETRRNREFPHTKQLNHKILSNSHLDKGANNKLQYIKSTLTLIHQHEQLILTTAMWPKRGSNVSVAVSWISLSC